MFSSYTLWSFLCIFWSEIILLGDVCLYNTVSKGYLLGAVEEIGPKSKPGVRSGHLRACNLVR